MVQNMISASHFSKKMLKKCQKIIIFTILKFLYIQSNPALYIFKRLSTLKSPQKQHFFGQKLPKIGQKHGFPGP